MRNIPGLRASSCIAMRVLMASAVFAAFALSAPRIEAAGDRIPTVGGKAPDFLLESVDGPPVKLSTELQHGPVVLVVLRGWPGYQCPFCTKQFGDFLSHAAELETRGAIVIFIYPGPSGGLKEHAEEFRKNHKLPANFKFVVDPGYTFTNAYGLRWDAKGETAYPATFVIDGASNIRFLTISNTHGGRASAAEVESALRTISR